MISNSNTKLYKIITKFIVNKSKKFFNTCHHHFFSTIAPRYKNHRYKNTRFRSWKKKKSIDQQDTILSILLESGSYPFPSRLDPPPFIHHPDLSRFSSSFAPWKKSGRCQNLDADRKIYDARVFSLAREGRRKGGETSIKEVRSTEVKITLVAFVSPAIFLVAWGGVGGGRRTAGRGGGERGERQTG